MKSVMLIFGAAIIILLMAGILIAIDTVRAEPRTEAHVVITGASENTSTLTLYEEVLDAETANIEISSNFTADAPIPASYTESTSALLVVGLSPSQTRTLTVEYDISRLRNYFFLDLIVRSWPMFLGLGVLGIIAGAVVSATRKDGA